MLKNRRYLFTIHLNSLAPDKALDKKGYPIKGYPIEIGVNLNETIFKLKYYTSIINISYKDFLQLIEILTNTLSELYISEREPLFYGSFISRNLGFYVKIDEMLLIELIKDKINDIFYK